MKTYDLIIDKYDGTFGRTIVTEQMINTLEHKFKSHTSYVPDEDLTIVWAVEYIELPEGTVDLNRRIIGFVYGQPTPQYDDPVEQYCADMCANAIHEQLQAFVITKTLEHTIENHINEITEVQ